MSATRLMFKSGRGSLTAFKLTRLYRSEKGIWRYEIERDGRLYYASLHTRDEAHARGMYARIAKVLSDWETEKEMAARL